MTIQGVTTYMSTSSFDDLVNFYKTEMTSRGWKEQTNENQSGVAVLGYVSGNNGALVMVMDGYQLGMTENVVLTTNMDK